MTYPGGSPPLHYMTNSRKIEPFSLDAAALGAAVDLPYDPPRYFSSSASSILLPLSRLVLSRARPKGIANAAKLMRAAYQGRETPRDPVSVRKLDGDWYLLLDGNSTTINAWTSGWPDLPCELKGDDF